MKFSRRRVYALCWLPVAFVGTWMFGVWDLPIPTWISKGMSGDPIIRNESMARMILKVLMLPITLFVSQWFITLLILKLRVLLSIAGFVRLYVKSVRGILNFAAVIILLIAVRSMVLDAGSSIDSYFAKIIFATSICAGILFLQPPVGVVLGSSSKSCDILEVTGKAVRPLRTVHLFRGIRPKRMIHITPQDNMRTYVGRAWRTSVRLLIESVAVIVIDGRYSTLPIDDELKMIRKNPPRGVVILVTNDDGSAPLLANNPDGNENSDQWVRVRYGELYRAASASLFK